MTYDSPELSKRVSRKIGTQVCITFVDEQREASSKSCNPSQSLVGNTCLPTLDTWQRTTSGRVNRIYTTLFLTRMLAAGQNDKGQLGVGGTADVIEPQVLQVAPPCLSG